MALVPVFCALGLTLALGALSVVWLPDVTRQLLSAADSGAAYWGAWFAGGLAGLLGVVLSAFIGLSLAQPLAGPALEQLVRRREAALGADPKPATSFLADMWRSLQSLLIGYAVGLPLLALLFAVSLLVPAAVVITVPAKLLVAAGTMAWDICDYPMSVSGLPVRARLALLWRYRAAVGGIGLGLAIGALVPCGALLLLPAGVAGAAQLIHEIEAYEGTERQR